MEGFSYGYNELVGLNSKITPNMYKYFEKAVMKSARQARVGREIMGSPLGPLGFGRQVYNYDALTEISDAVISMILEDGDDITKLAATPVKIPILQKAFSIPRRTLESSRQDGKDLDTIAAESAAYKVALQEEALILNGWSKDGTNYEIDGLYQAANNSYTTSKDFGTAGNAIVAVGAAIGNLAADHIYPPYNVVLHPTQHAELYAYTSGHSLSNYEEVLRMLGGGKIFQSATLTAGTGMVLATPNRGHFKLVIAQDILTEYWDEKKATTYGRVFEALVPIINEPNSICTMTQI